MANARVIVDVVNLTLDGTIQQVIIPNNANSATIKCRTNDDVYIYDSATGTDYWTLSGGGELTLQSFNMRNDYFYVKGTNTKILEILYFTIK